MRPPKKRRTADLHQLAAPPVNASSPSIMRYKTSNGAPSSSGQSLSDRLMDMFEAGNLQPQSPPPPSTTSIDRQPASSRSIQASEQPPNELANRSQLSLPLPNCSLSSSSVHLQQPDLPPPRRCAKCSRRARTPEPRDVGRPQHVCSFCGALFWHAERCKATSRVGALKYNKCCRQGRIALPPLQEPPLVRICYAMTINKSQGQSLDVIGVYLPDPIFSHGQLYVALSRATSCQGLGILISNDEEQHTGITRNVVFKEIYASLATASHLPLWPLMPFSNNLGS